jgi:dissimilatory sulfite reductase (desulfoviridin) alpha/beta subunit
MKWTKEAEEAMLRVPFFVRKKVRKRVEEVAACAAASTVRMEHVRLCRQKFLDDMESEVKGHQIETCFGSGGCPNRTIETHWVDRLEEILSARNLKAFLKERVHGSLKMHHEFRISISDCPNACSRPQIADVGIIGARRPRVVSGACTRCAACVEICREKAIVLEDSGDGPLLDLDRCVTCGQCINVCPSGALEEAERGYRILVGGKLGRHPRLARELEGIHSEAETLKKVEQCVDHHMKHNQGGERFGDLLDRVPQAEQ